MGWETKIAAGIVGRVGRVGRGDACKCNRYLTQVTAMAETNKVDKKRGEGKWRVRGASERWQPRRQKGC